MAQHKKPASKKSSVKAKKSPQERMAQDSTFVLAATWTFAILSVVFVALACMEYV